MPALMPCPVCGEGNAVVRDGKILRSVHGQQARTARVVCRSCGFKTEFEYDVDTAIDVWNGLGRMSPAIRASCYVYDLSEGVLEGLPKNDRVFSSAKDAIRWMDRIGAMNSGDGRMCVFTVEAKE